MVRQSARSLVDEIERDSLESSVPITDLLRKCIVLARHTNSNALRDWARQELRGYDSVDGLPEYRRINAPICIDVISGMSRFTGQQIGAHSLPQIAQDAGISGRFPLLMSISEISSVSYADGDDSFIKFSLPDSPILVQLMNQEIDDEFQQITALYWKVSKHVLQGLVDQVRSALVELITEVIDEIPPGEEEPTREETDRAVNIVLQGGARGTVNLLNTSAGGNATVDASSVDSLTPTPPPPEEQQSWFHRWRRRGIIVGISTFIAALVGTFTWFDWKPWE